MIGAPGPGTHVRACARAQYRSLAVDTKASRQQLGACLIGLGKLAEAEDEMEAMFKRAVVELRAAAGSKNSEEDSTNKQLLGNVRQTFAPALPLRVPPPLRRAGTRNICGVPTCVGLLHLSSLCYVRARGALRGACVCVRRRGAPLLSAALRLLCCGAAP